MNRKTLLVLFTVLAMALVSSPALAKKKKRKKKDKHNITKIIPKKEFMDALLKLADDERVPVASSTLVEKGRGKEYYSVEKLFDNDLETFWAEGAKKSGYHEWIAFHIPDDSTHLEIVPGAGKEQFENFNRPRKILVDFYSVKFKRDKETDKLKPSFKWLGRSKYTFKDKPQPVRKRIPVKLPELAMAQRTMYVGVIILEKVYKGQFDDTSIAEIKTSAVWGEDL